MAIVTWQCGVGNPFGEIAMFGKRFQFVRKSPGLDDQVLTLERQGIPGYGVIYFEAAYGEKKVAVGVEAKDLPRVIAQLQEYAAIFEKEGTGKMNEATALATKLAKIEAILKE